MQCRTIDVGLVPHCATIGFRGTSCCTAVGAGPKVHMTIDNHSLSFEGHTAPVTAVAFDANCDRLVGGSDSGSLRLWDATTGDTVRSFPSCHRSAITTADYHPMGEFIITGSKDTHVRIWDARKKSALQVYKNKDAPSECQIARFAPDGRTAISANADGTVRLYNLVDGRVVETLQGHSSPITSVAFHPSRCALAVASSDAVTAWDLETKENMFTLRGTGATQVVFSEGSLLALGARSIRTFDLPTYTELQGQTGIRDAPWELLEDAKVNNDVLFVAERAASSIKLYRTDVKRRSGVAHPPPRRSPSTSREQSPLTGGAPSSFARSPAPTAGQSPVRYPSAPEDAPPASPPREHPSPPVASALARAPAPVAPRRASNPNLAQLRQEAAARAGGGVRQSPPPAGSGLDAAMSEEHIVGDLLKRGDTMATLMQRRLTQVKVLRTMWEGDPGRAVSQAEKFVADTKDYGCGIDLLAALHTHQRVKERVQMEHLPALLRLVHILLTNNDSEPFLLVCVRATKTLNSRFRHKIDEALRGERVRAGVDLSMEARIEKSRAAQDGFDRVHATLSQYIARNDTVGEEVRALSKELPPPRRA